MTCRIVPGWCVVPCLLALVGAGLVSRTAFAQSPAPDQQAETSVPLLVVLADTGQEREGLHVFKPHPDGEARARRLLRGFPARVVRLYRLEQTYLQRMSGSPIEPAYLEFSNRQGGFPGFGFWLGGAAKPKAGYVDLREESTPRPRFGAVDQIFPHELAHVMMQQLLGHGPDGHSTQGHALGVRTDQETAFSEGFAEHFQVMALDDPDAAPETRRLVSDGFFAARAERDLAAYREALTARFAPAARPRVGFLLWFSGDEQAMRYYAVKANAFSRQPAIPERLLHSGDPYAAYLLENILAASASDVPRSVPQMMAIEGVVSTFFCRWAASDALRTTYRDEAFYAPFGASRADVPPVLNVYLKLFHVFFTARPRTTFETIAAYKAAFPDEAPAVDAVVRDVFLGQPLAAAPEIWLANRSFQVGTWMYDQFRAMPQPHTFDLNAASLVDLVAVPGVDLDLARAIRQRAPYASLADLHRVPGLEAATFARFEQMASEMKSIEAGQGDGDTQAGLRTLFLAFATRALLAWLIASVAAAALFRFVRGCGWLRAAFSGLGASLAALLAAWTIGPPLAAFAAPLIVFGAPGLLVSLARRAPGRVLATTLLGWLAAALPAAILVTPLF